eukprot:scaffold238115_cov16-Tisochrysis_lutea.AAC.1
MGDTEPRHDRPHDIVRQGREGVCLKLLWGNNAFTVFWRAWGTELLPQNMQLLPTHKLKASQKTLASAAMQVTEAQLSSTSVVPGSRYQYRPALPGRFRVAL